MQIAWQPNLELTIFMVLSGIRFYLYLVSNINVKTLQMHSFVFLLYGTRETKHLQAYSQAKLSWCGLYSVAPLNYWQCWILLQGIAFFYFFIFFWLKLPILV